MAGVQTWKSHFGMAQEVSGYGSTVATPTVWIPVASFDEYDDDMGLVFDDAIRANATKLQQVYPGAQQAKYSNTFNYYPNECARFWPYILGADTLGGTSSNGGWIHTFTSTGPTPYSATLFDFYGYAPERQFVGAQMDSLNFRFDRASGMATIKPHWMSAAASTGISETTASFGSTVAFRGWEAVFSIGGSTKLTLLTYDLTATRDVTLLHVGNNSQRPGDREVGQIDVTGKLSLYGSTDGPYTDYRANTVNAISAIFTDTTSTTFRLEIDVTAAHFTKVSPDRSGPFLRWDVDFRGKYNTTDLGPFSVITTIATSSSLST